MSFITRIEQERQGMFQAIRNCVERGSFRQIRAVHVCGADFLPRGALFVSRLGVGLLRMGQT